MKRIITASLIAMAALTCLSENAGAQTLELKGVKANAGYDNGDTYVSEYLGWDS